MAGCPQGAFKSSVAGFPSRLRTIRRYPHGDAEGPSRLAAPRPKARPPTDEAGGLDAGRPSRAHGDDLRLQPLARVDDLDRGPRVADLGARERAEPWRPCVRPRWGHL